jgi:hypothetical protein
MTIKEKVNAIMEFMMASEKEEIMVSFSEKKDSKEFEVHGVGDEEQLVHLFTLEGENPEEVKMEFEILLNEAIILTQNMIASLQDYDA